VYNDFSLSFENIMHLSRYNYARRRSPLSRVIWLGCMGLMGSVCAVIALLAALALPSLPSLALQAAGFEASGSTEALFSATSPAPAPLEMPLNSNQISVRLGSLPPQTISTSSASLRAAVGTDALSGQPVMAVVADEAALASLCARLSAICGPDSPTVRRARFDLKPGGVIVYGEFFIPQLNTWQPAGIVMQQRGIRLSIVGVDLNGTLYTSAPPPFADLLQEIETVANQVISQAVISSGGNTFSLRDVYIDETQLELRLR
jgi:hypothetical protein